MKAMHHCAYCNDGPSQQLDIVNAKVTLLRDAMSVKGVSCLHPLSYHDSAADSSAIKTRLERDCTKRLNQPVSRLARLSAVCLERTPVSHPRVASDLKSVSCCVVTAHCSFRSSL